jgi:phosphatidylinositol 4-kinase
MIIHLDIEWDDAILERLALVIAQQSLHFALQLNWILQGVLEDYQPELYDGTPNPTYDPLFHSRALIFLKNVERCVVYGKPRAPELQRLYEQGKITKKELVLLEQADRRFNALQITAQADADTDAKTVALDGWLYVQPPSTTTETSASPSTKPPETSFSHRFCSLQKHVLNCYTTQGCCSPKLVLDRAMSLERAKVTVSPNLIIRVQTVHYEFRLRCNSAEEQKLWARRLREEAQTSVLFQSGSATDDGPNHDDKVKKDLTPAQLERYDFFSNERGFVQRLTDIAEELRDKDRGERKKLAPEKMASLVIPETVYLPLCNSSDIWRRVSTSLPTETRVFNTKERCPVIMNFVSKRGEAYKGSRLDPNLDLAEFMHSYFEVVPETTEMEHVIEGDEEDAKEDEDGADKDPINRSEHSLSNVWHHEEDDDDPNPPHSPTRDEKRGNRRVERLLKENVVVLPAKIERRLARLVSRRGRASILDRATEMQPLVPILEGSRSKDAGPDDVDNSSVNSGMVSVEQSSIMIKDVILLGDQEEGDIDRESIDRAKFYVSGGESWAEKSARMLEKARKEPENRENGGQGAQQQLEIAGCLAKSNDDLRQEVFVMQMLHYYKSVFAQAKLPLWLKTYRILSTSSSTGLLEVLTDATSLDALKKSDGYPTEGGLRKYFEICYGGPKSKAFKAAQTNFMQSLAAYSLVSYLLGLKDRHNGNIMIDTRGHLIFIDFGFAMGMKPGHEFSFEQAPFKLTKEHVEVMDGVGSECYKEFQRLFVAGFEEARKNSQIALGLVEIMMYKSNYPCFTGWRYGGGTALVKFEQRLMLNVRDKNIKRRALRLISKSKQHFGTYLYDAFQKATNGYAI